MALLSLDAVSFAHGGPPLLDGVTLQIERGERIALLGRNGTGKSTLLKLLADELQPDNGEVQRGKAVRVARLVQEVPAGSGENVLQVVLAGATEHAAEHDPDWQLEQQAERVIGKMNLDPTAAFESLSSGMKRRVLLARTLAGEPDVLLLDEPTNHLDVESITWLEGFLSRFAGTLLFVTHDRAFLRRLGTRILELDRGRLYDWTCDYDTFLVRKEDTLEAEATQQAHFDKKLAQEEVWIRQGVKARRTRNEGRVRALEDLRRQRAARREKTGTAKIAAQEGDRSGRLVLEAKQVSFAYESRPIVRDLSLTLMRGDKLGLLGPNGCGKTTLLRLLLGDLQPDSGSIRQGTNLQIAYFDQLRNQIDDDKTVQENVGEGAVQIQIGERSRHIIGYLQDFLFTPDRARSLAGSLSGGERNRLLLAKLFTRPSNVLVLDEPTNDLDLETLELLESLLVEYSGTVLLVSHDRAFLDNVATSVLAYEGDGRFKEYDGGYADWQRGQKETPQAVASLSASPDGTALGNKAGKPRKLSFKEQRELTELPAKIERLETEQRALAATMSDPAFFRDGGDKIAVATARTTAIGAELKAAYSRWELLDQRAAE